jgi:tryptophan halogenase
MQVKSVLIVGGGSSGWMTAAALVKQLPHLKVTLVESHKIGTIGVGESTIGHINDYMRAIGLKDKDHEWMPKCNATYKTSIRFTDFREKGEELNTFHYPFGVFDYTDKTRGTMEWFHIQHENPSIPPENFAEFYHDHVIMANQNKFTDNKNFEIRGFNFALDTAYHMDAALFGQYVKDNICIPGGVTHIIDDVTGSIKNDEGWLTGVTTKENGVLKADLYVDCTGFKSLLLEGAMNSEFTSFHDTLMNDSAIATIIPYIDKEKEMNSVTNCTAIEAGWVWNIPLYNRIGTGYVYSSKFATQEEAEAQFRKHLASNRMDYHGEGSEKRAQEAEFRHIKIKHGCHKESWIKNVVAIGLSNGFIEPLESTGLMLTHEGIMKMIDTIEMRDGIINQFDIDAFNFAFYDQIVGFKDFISLHYALSKRNDTPYWKHVTENIRFSQSMVDWEPRVRDACKDLAMRNLTGCTYDENMGGLIYIAAGHGYNPLNRRFLDNRKNRWLINNSTEENASSKALDTWNEHLKELQVTLDKLPTHYQWLKENYYNNEE